MVTNKIIYIIIGVIVGVAGLFLFGKISIQDTYAAPAKSSETVSNQDFIAIASLARSDTNILWLIDTRNKKLLLYEYYSENVVKLKCVRDIQYDINIPDGVMVPDVKNADPSPNEVSDYYDRIRKNQKK